MTRPDAGIFQDFSPLIEGPDPRGNILSKECTLYTSGHSLHLVNDRDTSFGWHRRSLYNLFKDVQLDLSHDTTEKKHPSSPNMNTNEWFPRE